MDIRIDPEYARLASLVVTPGEKIGEDGRQPSYDAQLDEITGYRPPEGLDIADRMIPGINGAPDVRIRVYRNPGAREAPLLVNIHGGGFFAGGLGRDDHRCAAFALGVPCTVVSVQYRLAPETVYPGQLEDCLAAVRWAHENGAEIGIDPSRIALLGSSAGGCIAAGLCLYIRDKGGPKIAMQILNFPSLDCAATTVSCHQLYANAPFVKVKGLHAVWKSYLGDFDGADPPYYAVPALARNLADLPPALVVTCEYDPLRDEGIEYARRLMENAVPTELYSLPRVPHAFDHVPAAMTAWIREGMFRSLRREFG